MAASSPEDDTVVVKETKLDAAERQQDNKAAKELGLAFIIRPPGKNVVPFEAIRCHGEYEAIRKVIGGGVEFVVMKELPRPTVKKPRVPAYAFEMLVDENSAFKESCGFNDLGAYVIDACGGDTRAFHPFGVRGPVLLIAAGEDDGRPRSLTETQVNALTKLCRDITQLPNAAEDEEEYITTRLAAFTKIHCFQQ